VREYQRLAATRGPHVKPPPAPPPKWLGNYPLPPKPPVNGTQEEDAGEVDAAFVSSDDAGGTP